MNAFELDMSLTPDAHRNIGMVVALELAMGSSLPEKSFELWPLGLAREWNKAVAAGAISGPRIGDLSLSFLRYRLGKLEAKA